MSIYGSVRNSLLLYLSDNGVLARRPYGLSTCETQESMVEIKNCGWAKPAGLSIAVRIQQPIVSCPTAGTSVSTFPPLQTNFKRSVKISLESSPNTSTMLTVDKPSSEATTVYCREQTGRILSIQISGARFCSIR